MSMRRGLAFALLFVAGLAAGEVDAQTGPDASAAAGGPSGPPPGVTLALSPIFGADATEGDGWTEVVARVSNAGPTPARGALELVGAWYSATEDRFVARAPFHVLPHAEAVLRIPLRVPAYSGASATVTAKADDGAKLAEATVSFGGQTAPMLVDVNEPSRLSVVMRGWPIEPTWHTGYAPAGTTMSLTVGVPSVEPATGELVMPDRAAAYAAATVVVIPSDRLARLDGVALQALVGWVLAGGTLAVVPMRPEDLRTGVLTTLTGGPVTRAAAPPIMMLLPGATRAGGVPSFGAPPPSPWGAPPAPEPETAPDGGATPIAFFVPVRTTPFAPGATIGPSPTLRRKLVGYAGGNLAPSEYGATAAYGLGQVHVLGFDPTTSPALEDPWMHGRLLDMVSDAWDRHALFVFPHGGGLRQATNLFEVHRALDPNQNFRPALGIAAILLVLYSIAAGPLTFMRARKRGRPLEPLVWAPIASATCFALIVLVGLAGKGWGGRARHLALVEAGAGMSRGSVRRFRGFFASQTRAMRVRASEPGSVLDVLTTDARGQGSGVLRLDKDGASLEDLTSLPWQTAVVSEDGFTELGGGIAVRQKSDGSVVVANRSGHKLKDVIVWAPQTDANWFASIDDGTTVVSTAGRRLFVPSTRASAAAGTRVVHALETSRWNNLLGGHAADEMTPWWSAMSSAGGSAVDWFPDDVPVVMGEIEGGEGAKSDAGLRVESDRLLFRVVGEGGAT
jgi:hypothetical protein